MICAECNGRGWGMASLSGDFADCLTCGGKGKVLDFAVPIYTHEETGRTIYRTDPNSGEAWRFSLVGAQVEVGRIIRHGGFIGYKPGTNQPVYARPNSIVRVYLK